MKITRAIGTPNAKLVPLADQAPHARATYLRSVAPPPRLAINTAPLRLQQALAQVEELEQALASSRKESIIAQHQVALLIENNLRLSELAARREHEVEKVRHFAHHDELTGLPNRTLLLDRLNQALVRAKRQQKQLALLLLDLDGFKNINDRLGHAAGDKLLQRVAERLLSCVRGGDTACRYGGDEFVLLLPEVDDENRALAVAEKIRARLAKPYKVDDYSIAVTASIGVAVYPIDGMSQNDLIKQADVAMYHAKTVKGTAKTRANIVAAR
jgi:diguanylate cyclase (GGDEF)-like protein